jgi:hypothetical protein
MSETVHINPTNCTIIAKGQHMHMHATPLGSVTFKSKLDCNLTFKTVALNNPVFKETTLALLADVDATLPVICKTGRTEVTIDTCQYALTLSDPTDIIVP